jgi:CRISPR-associated protein Cas5h
MEKIISIDLKGDFGFFRKPDANNTINLSYNMLHKPALLGILGAIVGLEGYKEKGVFPKYYQKLKNLKIGIAPLGDENGNFQKTVIKYSNTVGYANKGTTYLTEEATLVKPAYRVFILVNMENEQENKLLQHLKNGTAEYIPYFGKNEHFAWWEKESFVEYEFEETVTNSEAIRFSSFFKIHDDSEPLIDLKETENMRRRDRSLGMPFVYFERLPAGFNEPMFQYNLSKIIFSNYVLKPESKIKNIFRLSNGQYIQLL